MKKSVWPTLAQWTLIFVVAIWATVTVCTGVVISIFCRVVKWGVPIFLIGFLAQAQSYRVPFDPAGNVTLKAQVSGDSTTWEDSPFHVILEVDRETMVASSAMVYSNNVALGTFALAPPVDGKQIVDVSQWITAEKLGANRMTCMIRWKMPTYDPGAPTGAEPKSIVVIVACSCAVLVIGGISIYQIVRMCNRINTTNAPPIDP